MAYPNPGAIDSFRAWWVYLDQITYNWYSPVFLIVVFAIAFIASHSFANVRSDRAFLSASFITAVAAIGIWSLGSMQFKWLVLPALLFAVAVIVQKKGVEVGG